ncbi:MAG: carboxylesterase family protein [Polyangiales bacterium]
MRITLASLSLLAACSSTTTPATSDASLRDAVADLTDASGDAGGCTVALPSDPLLARVENGLLRGAVEGESRRWLGIPFAAPPVGALRWRPPAPVEACWQTPRDATAWAPACPQVPQSQTTPFDPNAPIVGQEDCLTLNVWRPAQDAPAPRPVMVFIHGGGNVVGSAGETSNDQRLFEASRLSARGDVVVVTLQYRLGPLGWLSHRALDGATNLALLDQIAGLRWVQRNIAAFGGDPARVMVFGESAGAVNTCALLASPPAAGLFSRAAMESGSCTYTQSAQDAAAQGDRFVQAAGCAAAADPAACLRALPVEQVLRALPAPVTISGLGAAETARWGPVISPATLPERPYDALLAGRHHRVPILVGHNTEEVGLAVPAIATEEAYRATLATLVGAAAADRIASIYTVARFRTPRAALVQVLTDARFGCQARAAARAAHAGGSPTWRYLFAQPLESAAPAVRALGAWHGLELLYVFQHMARFGGAVAPGDLAAERIVLGAWTRFAATGDPGGDTAFPRYARGMEPTLRIASTAAVEAGWRNAECDGWDTALMITPPAP